jgi:hypothetical protein
MLRLLILMSLNTLHATLALFNLDATLTLFNENEKPPRDQAALPIYICMICYLP